MNKKGEDTLRNLLIMLTLFSAVIIGFNYFMGGVSTAVSGNLTDIGYMSQLSEMNQSATDMKVTVEALATGDIFAGVSYVIFKGIPDFFKAQITSLQNMMTLVFQASDVFMVPSWVTWVVITIIFFIILFAVVNVIFGKERG